MKKKVYINKSVQIKKDQKTLDASLFKAVIENDVISIRKLIAKGANVNSLQKDSIYDGISCLYQALFEGNIETAKILIDLGADLNLHIKLMRHISSHPLDATLYGKNNVEGLRLMINSGVDLTSFNDKRNPLMALCSILPKSEETYDDVDNKLFEYCKILIENGVDVNFVAESGETPLFAASVRGYTKIAGLLLEKGANKNLASCFMFEDYKSISEIEDKSSNINNIAYIVCMASGKNNIKILQNMKNHGVDLNISFEDRFGIKTALNSTLSTSTTEWLLQNGVSPIKTNIESEELCKATIDLYGTQKLELLLKAGSNPNDRWKYTKATALHTALENDLPYQKAKLLLEYGADITAIDNDQLSVMHYILKNDFSDTLPYMNEKGGTFQASEKEILDTINLLLEKGANPVAKDVAGNSPLHMAAKNGYGKKVIDKLIEIGNSSNEKNLFGETPAIIAAKNFKEQTFKMLASSADREELATIVCLSNVGIAKKHIDKAESLNIGDCENYTLLHYAVLRNSPTIVKALVNKGIDLDAFNKYFKTALDLAKIKSKPEIITYLENKGATTYIDSKHSYHNQLKNWMPRTNGKTVINYTMQGISKEDSAKYEFRRSSLPVTNNQKALLNKVFQYISSVFDISFNEVTDLSKVNLYIGQTFESIYYDNYAETLSTKSNSTIKIANLPIDGFLFNDVKYDNYPNYCYKKILLDFVYILNLSTYRSCAHCLI
jgi:ankyrin repeat protein